MKEVVYQRPILKALSLFIAVTLWLYVQGDRQEEKDITVSVDILNRPANLVITKEFDPVLTLHVKGPRARIGRLKSGQMPHYQMNLENAKQGLNTLWFQEAHIKLPHGVSIKSLTPKVLRLELDELISRELKVVPKLVGELNSGYKIADLHVEPATVTVSGPAHELESMTQLNTDPLMLKDIVANTERLVSLEPLGTFVQFKDKTVKVSLKLEDGPGEKKFSGVMISINVPGETITSLPETIEVSGKGFASVLSKLKSEDLSVQLNAWDLEIARSWDELSMDVCKFLQPKVGVEFKCSPAKVKLLRHQKK